MIGYFSRIEKGDGPLEWVVTHDKPRLVPPPHHRVTGAKVIEASVNQYLVVLDGGRGSWCSYPDGKKLHWTDAFMTRALKMALKATGDVSLSIVRVNRGYLDLKPHKWPLPKEVAPTLWEHLLDD